MLVCGGRDFRDKRGKPLGAARVVSLLGAPQTLLARVELACEERAFFDDCHPDPACAQGDREVTFRLCFLQMLRAVFGTFAPWLPVFSRVS
jgi:hypothetical protein